MKTSLHKLAHTKTGDASCYHIHKRGVMMMGLESFKIEEDEDTPLTSIHIHLLSKGKVKKGDWFIQEGELHHTNYDLEWEGYFKVVGSTDPNLGVPILGFDSLIGYISSRGEDDMVRVLMEGEDVLVPKLENNQIVTDVIKHNYPRIEVIEKINELIRTADFIDFTKEYGIHGWSELKEWIGRNI